MATFLDRPIPNTATGAGSPGKTSESRPPARLFIAGISALFWILSGFLALVTMASLFGRLHWGFELLSHFRVQLAALSLALAGMGCLLIGLGRHWRGALVAGLMLAVNTAPLVPYMGILESNGDAHASIGPNPGRSQASLASADPEIGTNARFKAISFNLYRGQVTPADLLDFVRTEEPDLLLLTELPENDRAVERLLLPLERGLPFRLEDRRGSLFDVVLLTRWRPVAFRFDRRVDIEHPVLAADLCHPSRATEQGCLRVIGLHAVNPAAPIGRGIFWRNRQLELAAQYAGARDGRTLLLGDLNLTPWSPYFSDLLQLGRLHDSGIGHGLAPSWTGASPLLGLNIDHALVGDRLTVQDRRLGPAMGSDHRPLIVDIALR